MVMFTQEDTVDHNKTRLKRETKWGKYASLILMCLVLAKIFSVQIGFSWCFYVQQIFQDTDFCDKVVFCYGRLKG